LHQSRFLQYLTVTDGVLYSQKAFQATYTVVRLLKLLRKVFNRQGSAFLTDVPQNGQLQDSSAKPEHKKADDRPIKIQNSIYGYSAPSVFGIRERVLCVITSHNGRLAVALAGLFQVINDYNKKY
jgi:hypothetical protein